ncbi:hypothetical protein J7E73_31690 [Paenibacillus albidus]|uniref:WD40/YVTN/BNR-like repeat-containing protein n=1 Tax=Paenibacillus albidus TaxID=2041023 RepID=UPI001BEB8C29|nr:hypothetical protein [Paenibacillus albidus]MBT2293576.1 hypothetical protein [Paenibacillus albidus]
MNKKLKLAVSVSLLAVLLSGCANVSGDSVSGSSGAQGSPSGTQVAAVTPASAEPSPFANIRLSGLQLAKDHTLYVWGNSDESTLTLFQSTDGGARWKRISPENPELPGSAYAEPTVTAYDRNHLWLFPGEPGDTKTAWYSADGGSSWKQSPTKLPYMFSQQSVFLHETEGYLLSQTDAAMGSSGKVLYETQDGGATWNLVTSNISLEGGFVPALDGSFPTYGFTDYGMSFRDREHGWVPLQTRDERPHVVQTSDAGKSWQEVSLPVPSSRGCLPQIMAAPSFYGDDKQEAWMPLQCSSDNSAQLGGYYSQDGGKTWAYRNFREHAARVEPSVETAMTFISLQEGWMWDGEQLTHTTDAGVTWKPVGGRAFVDLLPDKPQLLDLVFDGPDQGWALVRNETDSRLLHTEDGGVSWAYE